MKSDVNSARTGKSRVQSPGSLSGEAGTERTIVYGPLPTLVGYQVRKAYSRLFQSFTEALEEIGLAPGQYGALELIGLNAGLSQMALADAAGTDPTTMVPITNRFSKAGWIRRTRRTEDRRLYSLRLTPTGQATLKKARPLVEAFETRFASELSPAERARVRTLLARIADIEADQADASRAPVDFGPLPGHIGYQLRRACSYLFRTFMAHFKHLKLAPGHYSALVLISCNAGMSQLDLADATSLDGSTIVPITNRFVEMGWIRRTRRQSDRRVYSLRITPAGQAVLDEARPLISAREKQLASVLSPRERHVLIDMLSRLGNAAD